MKKRLQTVIAIIVLGFITYLAAPLIFKELIFDDSGIADSQMILVGIGSFLVSAVLILFGAGKITEYAATADDKIKKKVKVLMYGGLILLVLPQLLPYVFWLTDVLFYLYPVFILEFLNKTMIHVVGFVILTIWGIKTAWDNKEKMEDRPVFYSFINYFSSLTKWGWAFYIFLVLLTAGYVWVLADGIPPEKPRDSVAMVVAPGSLNWDAFSGHKKSVGVGQDDTITKIHRIRETRMLITTAEGSHGWYDIPFIQSTKGWNGYLFKRIHSNDLKVSPARTSRAISEADQDGYRRVYQKNTDIRILEIRNDPEAFERNKRASPFAMWAKVSVWDNRAQTDIVGWLPYTTVRIHGQMHNSAKSWVWIPLKWINTGLGDGFFAGVVSFLLITILITTTAFIFTKFTSTKMRFLPNFILVVLLIIATVGLLYNFYYSFFDPSAFNWANWQNETAHLLYLGLVGAGGVGALKVFIQRIYEERCPNCKYWNGYVYNRKLLFRNEKTYKHWTKNTGDGSISNVRYETEINENWKDFCECGRCGNRWTLRRHVQKTT